MFKVSPPARGVQAVAVDAGSRSQSEFRWKLKKGNQKYNFEPALPGYSEPAAGSSRQKGNVRKSENNCAWAPPDGS